MKISMIFGILASLSIAATAAEDLKRWTPVVQLNSCRTGSEDEGCVSNAKPLITKENLESCQFRLVTNKGQTTRYYFPSEVYSDTNSAGRTWTFIQFIEHSSSEKLTQGSIIALNETVLAARSFSGPAISGTLQIKCD